MVDQRLRNGEVVAANQLVNQLVFGFALSVLPLFLLHAVADALLEGIQGFKIPQRLGKGIVQLRQALALDGLHLCGVGKGSASEALVGEILGIAHVEGTFLARVCPAQVLSKFRQGIGAADFYQDVVHLYALAALLLGRSCETDLGKVAISKRSALDGIKVRMLLTQAT